MAHAALDQGALAYGPGLYAIRARLFGRLRSGEARLGSLLDDERVKLTVAKACVYCASTGPLTMDHLLARSRGGPDSADNIVWACRSCNSSKGDRDLAAWYQARARFPPLLLLRRYLKLAHHATEIAGMLQRTPEEAVGLPFDLAAVPRRYPEPGKLTLWSGT